MNATSTLRLFAGAVICLFVTISCDRTDPTMIDDATAPLAAVRPSPTVEISTVAQFEANWNNGNFANGTTFLIKSGSVLVFASDQTFGNPSGTSPADDKSFSIVGEDTTAILKKINPETALFVVRDNIPNDDTGLHDVVIENIKFVVEVEPNGDNNASFVSLTNYGSVTMTDVVVDVVGQTVLVQCDELTVDGLQLRAKSSTGFLHKGRSNHTFNHTVRNSVFYRKSANEGPCYGEFQFSTAGVVTWEDNEFLATAASDGEAFYSVRVNTTPMDFVFDGNDFHKQVLLFNGACVNATVDLLLVGNNYDLLFCGDAVGDGASMGPEPVQCWNCEDSGDNFDLLVTMNTWSFEGDPFDYDDFGPISAQNACYDAGTVYVEFSLASTAAFEDFQDVEVEWGDDNCATGGGTVAATWNSTTSKWNASFDVSGIGDADVYWRGKGTLCSKTVSGDCIRRRFTLCGAGGIPVWFTQE